MHRNVHVRFGGGTTANPFEGARVLPNPIGLPYPHIAIHII
ncbi:hypothetical protein [Proteus sp. G2672]|nr:hypothetical protein [Proteus sp. G2672]